MNDEAQKVLAEMMQKALSGVDQAVEFGKAEIPVVVEQLLMWHAVKSGIYTLIAMLAFFSAYYVATRYWGMMANEVKKDILKQKDNVMIGAPILGGLGTIVFMLIGFSFLNLDWLQIIIAPKLYLLEYGASLVK